MKEAPKEIFELADFMRDAFMAIDRLVEEVRSAVLKSLGGTWTQSENGSE